MTEGSSQGTGVIPPGRYQLLVSSSEDVWTYNLPAQGTIVIGRGDASDVRIDDPSVSRRHALLHVGETLAIEDLGGPNGTMVREKAESGCSETLNLRKLHGRPTNLLVGDRVLFGSASILIRYAADALALDLTGGEGGVVVRDPAMQALYEQAARAARTPISVLVLGETGVGKELLARAVHAHSPRANGPFLGVDCSALNESLVESELFGYEKGAFTGAHQARTGLFESAAGGTVFLDEIGNLTPGTQAKLLRVLEQREVVRLGSNRPRAIDVRFVAATNRDLEVDSQLGRFRSDLFFRLGGISLCIPPLRERPLEIEPLARAFLGAACRQIECPKPLILAMEVLDILGRHAWPGNVRELKNVIERAVALCVGDTILAEHLPPSLLAARKGSRMPSTARPIAADPAASRGDPSDMGDLQSQVRLLERAKIVAALDRSGGNQSQAARRLGISRGTLLARIDAFGLPRPRKRGSGSETP